MTRQIKFRAWALDGNRYINWHEIGFLSVTRLVNDADFILEQYTGINDKNGKEIYEGDILDISKDGEPVVFINGCFEPACYFKSEAMQVIGNIHENPDLLK